MNNPFDSIAYLLSILHNIGYKSALIVVSILAPKKKLKAKLIKESTKLLENCKKCSVCNNLSLKLFIS